MSHGPFTLSAPGSLLALAVATACVAGCAGDAATTSGGTGGKSALDGGGASAGTGGEMGAGGGSTTGTGGTAPGGAPSDSGTTGSGGRGAAGMSGPAGGGSGGSTGGASSGTGGASTGGAASDLAGKYPGDVGIASDPAVVWTENFEEANVAAMFARYDDSKQQGLGFDTSSVPAKSTGKASAKLTASGSGPNAVDFFKRLPDTEELFVRYYAKYASGAPWHHTGVWIGGYNPPTKYPSPQAGLKPNGDDRFSVSLEPLEQGASPRLDFYNYWMKMHSWMDMPMGDTAYYGNSLVHDPTVVAKAEWQCIEIHVKLNTDTASTKGAELGVWIDDASVAQFTEKAPLGYWVKDKFCPDTAEGSECVMYRPASPTLVPLDLQYRSTNALKLNAFWPQNYITDTGTGSVWYDDMVLAKTRVGCLR